MTFAEAFSPFRALGMSWKLLRQAPLTLLVGGVILVITDTSNSGSGGFDVRQHVDLQTGEINWEVLAPLLGFLGVVVCCVAIVFFVLHSWVWVGFAGAVERVMKNGAADAGVVFEGRARLPSMLITRLVGGVFEFLCWVPLLAAVAFAFFGFRGGMSQPPFALGLVGLALLISFPAWVYVGLGLSLAKPAVALEGLHPLDALNRSWTLARGNRIWLLWFFFVTRVFAAAGLCLCCVGVFVTGTMYYTARIESYLALTRGDEMKGWWCKSGAAPVASEDWGAAPPA